MVAATYDAAMARVFTDEGGYTNDPHDPGGATNWGITIYDARKYWKANATPEDVRNMPKSVAAEIYKAHYANPINYDALPAGFDYSVLDAEINSGYGRAIAWAKDVLGPAVVGVSNMVLAANSAKDKVTMIQKYWARRLAFLHALKNWQYFGKGWGRRCAQGEAAAVKMWYKYGAAMNDHDVSREMENQSKAASTRSKNSVAKAGGSAAGSGALGLDLHSIGGKIVIALIITGVVVLIIYFVRQSIIHQQRSSAYLKEK